MSSDLIEIESAEFWFGCCLRIRNGMCGSLDMSCLCLIGTVVIQQERHLTHV